MARFVDAGEIACGSTVWFGDGSCGSVQIEDVSSDGEELLVTYRIGGDVHHRIISNRNLWTKEDPNATP